MFILCNIILPKLLDIIKIIDTTSIEKHNNAKKYSNLLQLREKNSQENLVKFTKDKVFHKFKDITLSLKVFWEVFQQKTSLMRITIMILKSLIQHIKNHFNHSTHSQQKTSLMHITIMILKSFIQHFKKQVFYTLIAIIINGAYLRDGNKQQ